ncbi:MAG: hypothetical protein JO019_01410 [Candidatus Kaiserbacteria bacterium]|nr:hypothetical protein [Candidatus Kaiserbacteria bacterium]
MRIRMIALLASIAYGLVAGSLIVTPWIYTSGTQSFLSGWWGVVTSAYLFLQVAPIAWLLHKHPFTKATWHWPWNVYNRWASYLITLAIAASIFLISSMNYWSFKIWLTSLIAGLADWLINYVESQLEKNAMP